MKAELYKYKKRKIYLLSVMLLIIPVLLAMNSIFASDPYESERQSLLYWCSNAIFMTSIMYVLPVIFSYASCINLSDEMDNQFIGMLSQRCGKKTVYRNKALAAIIVTSLLFLFEAAGCAAVYYLTYFSGGAYISGCILGQGYNIQAVTFIAEMFLAYCILIPLAANGISTYITGKNRTAILFLVLVFIGRMFPSNPVFNHIVPFNILGVSWQMGTGTGGYDLWQSLLSLGNMILVTLVIGLFCYFLGKIRICRLNL